MNREKKEIIGSRRSRRRRKRNGLEWREKELTRSERHKKEEGLWARRGRRMRRRRGDEEARLDYNMSFFPFFFFIFFVFFSSSSSTRFFLLFHASLLFHCCCFFGFLFSFLDTADYGSAQKIVLVDGETQIRKVLEN